MNFYQFYKEKLGFEPYQYQVKVAEVLLSGKNIILAVPTGSGKTWASVVPFLFAKALANQDFPSKMIYSLPLRALANSIFEDVSKVADASIQTGEYGEDKFFENDIIFSTIDQTLSNFLCFPLPLSPRQANVNAGALIGSYLVFDEFHLLEPELSMGTTLGMLRLLGETCRCCIMTATLSQPFMQNLQEALPNYEIITLDDFPEDRAKIKSLLPETNKKKLQVLDSPIEAQNIIAKHLGIETNKPKTTIVICNRVENAQRIFQELEQSPELKTAGTELISLHSRFFDKHRKLKEKKLKEYFGKGVHNTNAILVATQVIEAGMDISCSVMHTEISPINSFLQRAGRCARFENEIGQIFVYDILNIEERETIALNVTEEADKKEIRAINNKYLPYQQELVGASFQALKQCTALDGDIPKKLVESVLEAKELQIFGEMQSAFFNYDKITDSWLDCQKNNYRNTIRNIQSVEVILIEEGQKTEIAQYPYRYESVGVFKWSLVSWLNKISQSNFYNHETPLVWKLAENSFLGETFENDEEVKFALEGVTNFTEIPSQVYLNATYFGYSESLGLNWQFESTFGNKSPKKEWKEKKQDDFHSLKKDTFYQHNMGLIGCFEKEFLPKLDFVCKPLAKLIGKPDWGKNDFAQLIRLMIVLHDYGKLNKKWQKPMREYQAKKEKKTLEQFADILAHTDYNSLEIAQFKKKYEFGSPEYEANKPEDLRLEEDCGLKNRGGHAGVGAFVAFSIMGKAFKEKYEVMNILSPLATAIMQHHSPKSASKSFDDYTVIEGGVEEFDRLYNDFVKKWKYFDGHGRLKTSQKLPLEKYLVDFNSDRTPILMYFFLVRILRICDQRATENLEDILKNFNLYVSK